MTAGLNYYKIVLLQYETFGMKTRTKKSGRSPAASDGGRSVAQFR